MLGRRRTPIAQQHHRDPDQPPARRRPLLQEQLPDLQAQVDYIENVEGGSVITPARGAKVAPTSKQFSLLIAVVLGLIVGVLGQPDLFQGGIESGFCGMGQGLITPDAGCVFGALPWCRVRVRVFNDAANAPARAQVTCMPLEVAGGLLQAMVDMNGPGPLRPSLDAGP